MPKKNENFRSREGYFPYARATQAVDIINCCQRWMDWLQARANYANANLDALISEMGRWGVDSEIMWMNYEFKSTYMEWNRARDFLMQTDFYVHFDEEGKFILDLWY